MGSTRLDNRGHGCRTVLALVAVALLSAACGSDSESTAGTSSSSTTVTVPVSVTTCPPERARAAATYGGKLLKVSDRGGALFDRLAAELQPLVARGETVDRAEVGAAFRGLAGEVTGLRRDLSALGAPPPSYAEGVGLLSQALESMERGLETMAQGAEEDSGDKLQQGLALVSSGSDLVPKASAAVAASPTC